MGIPFGRYLLLKKIAAGGMGQIYLAQTSEQGFQKLVVLKRILPHLVEDDEFFAMFLDEARLAARLNHPNIAQIFDLGQEQGVHYIVMEYVAGDDIRRLVKFTRGAGRALPLGVALRIIADAAAGLDYAHKAKDAQGRPMGLVHRDVSPQNVLVGFDGGVKLIDFGVAKAQGRSQQTAVGVVKGKYPYMSPEQARGEELDGRSDVFGLGVVLWELLTGQRLFKGESDIATQMLVQACKVPPPSTFAADLPPELDGIALRALARAREDRFQDALAFRMALEELVLARRIPASSAHVHAFLSEVYADRIAAEADPANLDQLQPGEALQEAGVPGSPGSIGPTPSSRVGMARRSSTGGASAASTVVSRSMAPTGQTRAATQEELAAVPDAPVASRAGAPAPAPARSSGEVTRIERPVQRARPHRLSLGVASLALLLAGVLFLASRVRTAHSDLPAAAASTPLAAAGPPAPAPLPAPTLRLCGSNTIGAELAPALVEAFLKKKGESVVERRAGAEPGQLLLTAQHLPSPITVSILAQGTATAFRGFAAGTCEVGMASRQMNDQDLPALRAAGLGDLRAPATEHVVGLDGIAVVVHPNNPLRRVDLGQVREVFSGRIGDWSQLGAPPGPLALYARDANSGTFDLFRHLVLGTSTLAASARRFADSALLSDQVSTDPAAVGFIGLAYVRSARALPVGEPGLPATVASAFTVANESYPLSRRLYLYTLPRPSSPLVAELISFANSPEGQAEVRARGFVDLSVDARAAAACDASCPRPYAQAIRDAQRVSFDFRFRPGTDDLDSRAHRDLDRLVSYLRNRPASRLLLFGFSGGHPDDAAQLRASLRLAEQVGVSLSERGLPPAAVKGFGGALPVTRNDGGDQEKNRRVEVWLAKGS